MSSNTEKFDIIKQKKSYIDSLQDTINKLESGGQAFFTINPNIIREPTYEPVKNKAEAYVNDTNIAWLAELKSELEEKLQEFEAISITLPDEEPS